MRQIKPNSHDLTMFCYSKHMLIMDLLGLIDSSHELVSIYAISFIVRSCLVLLIGIQTSNVTWTKN